MRNRHISIIQSPTILRSEWGEMSFREADYRGFHCDTQNFYLYDVFVLWSLNARSLKLPVERWSRRGLYYSDVAPTEE
jgi:hypothetical protein